MKGRQLNKQYIKLSSMSRTMELISEKDFEELQQCTWAGDPGFRIIGYYYDSDPEIYAYPQLILHLFKDKPKEN